MVYGADLVGDKTTTEKGVVIEVINEVSAKIPGTDVIGIEQTLEIQIIKGEEKGKILQIVNDYNIFKSGDELYITHNIRGEDGFESHIVSDAYRIPTLVLFTILFIVLVILIGGMQGVRGLLSLMGSLALILFVLLPSITAGYSPVVISIVVSSFIIILGSYITHGFNKTTTSAVIGMIVTVMVTGVLAYVAVHSAKLTGLSSDESVFLNFNSRGQIDVVGVLLGGIMIGLLGVLYDIAIGQAIAVEELHTIAPHISKFLIYKRAIRIGREHIGALVNTLAIAYLGASLPLLLLFSDSGTEVVQIINREVFSAEIIRTLIGSIGLVLAVPITTLITVYVLFRSKSKADKKVIEKEMEEIKNHSHSH
ncbi:MAG: hypothetical protein JWP09_113 [Candidatus Taylorbacteria bacterium]|nr:hypothetical protein [Candidatus Taylorbacteria bacterium]